MMMNWNSLKNMDKDDLLKLIGLEERRETSDYLLPALGYFTAGLIIGAGVGMILAPKSGMELRTDLKSRLQSGAESLGQGYSGVIPGVEKTPRGV